MASTSVNPPIDPVHKNATIEFMRRVLVAIEDYQELTQLELLLKKLGFDVVGVRNDAAVPEMMVSFNPEVLVISAQGQRVNGTKLLPRIKKRGGPPRVILVAKNKSLLKADSLVDVTLESPIRTESLIEALAGFFGMDEKNLLDKFEQLKIQIPSLGDVGHIKSRAPAEPLEKISMYRSKLQVSERDVEKRKQTYERLVVATPLPAFQGFPKDKVAAQVKDFRNSENDPEIKAIDEERKAFVIALAGFGKKSK